MSTKIRLLDALVLPVALYGAETWARTQNGNSKLAAFEMKCLSKQKWIDNVLETVNLSEETAAALAQEK